MKYILRPIIIGLLIFLPIFITIEDWSFVGLSRAGGVASSGFTIPIGIAVAVCFILFNIGSLINNIIKCKFIFYIFFVIFIILFSNVVYGEFVFDRLKILIFILLNISLIIVFENFFSQIVYGRRGIMLSEEIFLITPIVIIIFLFIVGFVIHGRGYFLSKDIVIYDYEQYFSFFVVIAVSIIGRCSFILAILMFLFSRFIAIDSANHTAYVVGIFSMCYIVMNNRKYKISKEFYHLTIVALLVLFAIYPCFFYYFGRDLTDSHSMLARLAMINVYFANFDKLKFDFVFPIGAGAYSAFGDVHNELLEVVRAAGIYGLAIYYFIIKKIWMFDREYYGVGVTVAAIIFMGGITVENLLHLYMAIIISYVVAFYSACSRKNNDKVVMCCRNC